MRRGARAPKVQRMRASSRALGWSRAPEAAHARNEIRGGAHRGAQRFNGARRRAEELLVRASPQPQANLRTRERVKVL